MVINPSQFSNIELPYDKILARLGYAKGKTNIDDKTSAIITEVLETSKQLITPRQCVANSLITIQAQGKITLEPGLTINSDSIYNLLKDCSTAYGFAVTIGPHLEDKRDRYLSMRETARALILDAIGSVATEELAEITHRQIGEESEKQGLQITQRFSPGYGNWKISGQEDFLKWTGAQNIGIKLTPNFQMVPEKSVSAILGVRKRNI